MDTFMASNHNMNHLHWTAIVEMRHPILHDKENNERTEKKEEKILCVYIKIYYSTSYMNQFCAEKKKKKKGCVRF